MSMLYILSVGTQGKTSRRVALRGDTPKEALDSLTDDNHSLAKAFKPVLGADASLEDIRGLIENSVLNHPGHEGRSTYEEDLHKNGIHIRLVKKGSLMKWSVNKNNADLSHPLDPLVEPC